ncbi:hypothetical protein [Nocardioides dongxiaopingii]|uniref:hypothetical protein n=1 Tax=Nocardioides dongxiaopingii TaxID=2576036 RepID=UPI0010C76CF7|nr:hypothetical protein [Nocardioides dongxiaopingii]
MAPGPARGSDRLASLASALVAGDLPLTEDQADGLGRSTALHLASLPDGTRAGVRVAQGAVTIGVSVLGRRPYGRMSRAARVEAMHRLAATRLPLVSEYVRLVRGVALVVHHEDAPGGTTP